eukprot:Gb_07231 [translate_table: standard]
MMKDILEGKIDENQATEALLGQTEVPCLCRALQRMIFICLVAFHGWIWEDHLVSKLVTHCFSLDQSDYPSRSALWKITQYITYYCHLSRRFSSPADTGGGNALNVQRTIRDLIAAGAAGCFLEVYYRTKHGLRNVVIPAEEHAAKISAARDAIGESDFFLVARTDARAISAKRGLTDAIARVNLYMEVLLSSTASLPKVFTLDYLPRTLS